MTPETSPFGTLPEAKHIFTVRRCAVAAGGVTLAALSYALGFYNGQPNEDDNLRPHPSGLTTVYEQPFDTTDLNIEGYIEGSFDVTCVINREQYADPSGNVLETVPDFYHVSGSDTAGGVVAGFVEAVSGMRTVGSIPECNLGA